MSSGDEWGGGSIENKSDWLSILSTHCRYSPRAEVETFGTRSIDSNSVSGCFIYLSLDNEACHEE